MALYQEQRNEYNILEGYVRTTNDGAIPIESGNRDYERILKWIADGNTPDPDPNALDKVKASKIAEYKTEGVRRIGLQVTEWGNFETIQIVASLWNTLTSPNAAQTNAKNIYVYVKDTAIPNVNAQTNIADVQAIDVINDVNW